LLEALFAPHGIALIGASRNPKKLGHGIARNLTASGYAGPIYLVNPHGGELFGLRLYPGVLEIPGPFDLAVIATPAERVAGVLEECAKRGAGAAIVVSGGFRETGPAGQDLEREMISVARQHGVRVLGPNCIGYLDTRTPVDTTFLPPPLPPPGDIALIAHSGALCGALVDWARGKGFGFSRMINLGNASDITEAELIEAQMQDAHTRTVSLYLEGLADGPGFVQAASRLSAVKPVLAVKVGRSAAGEAAASSHTGALAGEDAAFGAASRKAGVLRAGTVEEMLLWSLALAWCPPLQGGRTAVLTNAGGPGVIAADALAGFGLSLAALGRSTVESLSALLPTAANVRNPVDMLASAGPEEYAQALGALLGDPGVDAVLPLLVPPPMFEALDVVGAILPICRAADKPVLMTVMGDARAAEARRESNAARVPAYAFPEQAVSALAALHEWAESQRQVDGEPLGVAVDASAEERRSLREEIARWPDAILPGKVAAELVQAYGVQTLQPVMVSSASAAAEAAEGLGFPVALKIDSPEITHKSDVGGVALGLGSGAAVAQGYEDLMERVSRAAPEAKLEGAIVQRMAPEGQDVIVGVARDAIFGPYVMFGSGGVAVEGLRDVAFALPPLTQGEAERWMESTWAGRRMRGFRGLPEGDREACLEAVLRLYELSVGFPELAEIEINPLRVLSRGRGALAIDVRARVA
jgi:acyl-CoA synthetase (NDP forming)